MSREPRGAAGSALGYGAANLGNLFRPLDDDEAHAILDAAWEAGIRSFDTAPHYGLGLSERRLGAFLRTKPREQYTLSTKAGRLLRPNPEGTGLDLDNDFHVPATLRREWDFSEAGVRSSLDESLDRLGLDRVDTLYLHDPERFDLAEALAEGLPALVALRDEGRVTSIGIGSMTTGALAAAVDTGLADRVMIAGRYTLLEQPAADDVLPACVAHSTAVVAASVFNSGLLARSEPSRAGRYEYGGVPDALWHRLERIVAVCRDHGVDLPAAAVQYPLRHPAVVEVVVGGSRPSQLAQSVDWSREPIPEEFWRELAHSDLIPAGDD